MAGRGGYNGRSRLELFIWEVKFPEDKQQCWEWLGAKDKNGYGKCAFGRAHRYSYEIFVGPVPSEKLVCHTCDNPSCVNPRHLWLGTNLENTADRNAKGRQANRQRIRPSLTIEQAYELRRLLTCGLSDKEGAEMFGISRAQAYVIRHSKTWHFRD